MWWRGAGFSKCDPSHDMRHQQPNLMPQYAMHQQQPHIMNQQPPFEPAGPSDEQQFEDDFRVGFQGDDEDDDSFWEGYETAR